MAGYPKKGLHGEAPQCHRLQCTAVKDYHNHSLCLPFNIQLTEQVTTSRSRSASFHTIQRLFDVEDRRSFALFKVERFLRDNDKECPWESFPERSRENNTAEGHVDRQVDVDMRDLVHDNRPPSNEGALQVIGMDASYYRGHVR